MSTITVTRNVVNTLTGAKGAVIRIKGDTAVVLVRETGKLAPMPVADLRPTKGRPVNLVRGLCRADVDELIDSDTAFRVSAVRELFGRQTDDERVVLATRWDNKVGFRADDARRGSELALKSACAWTDTDHATAKGVLHAYSGTQLFDLASEFLSEPGILADSSRDDTAEALIASIVAGL